MSNYSGMAIAIAWPEFVGKQTGSWYDTPMRWLGINRNFHYKVGHAALILVDEPTGVCYHLDCGRYHAPYQYGRIRDASTDNNLTIHHKAIISDHKILNLAEILNEVQMNKSSFGVGPMYASYCIVNFASAWEKVKEMQSQGAIPFGPFVPQGTNCCRFVRTGILAGAPSTLHKMKLHYLWPFKPTPMGNVACLDEEMMIPEVSSGDPANPNQKTLSMLLYNKNNVKGTLPASSKPEKIPPDSQWLSGEVAGGWFHLKEENTTYTITRYSSDGVAECTGQFRLDDQRHFNPRMPYSFSHLSHCQKVTIHQGNEVFEFNKIN